MSQQRIEDYAVIGDTQTAALVGRHGSIDWMCAPRFDSGAMFAALLGKPDNGRWQIAPAGGLRRVERRYRDGSLVLETTFHTDDRVVRLVDCMPVRGRTVDVVRVVEGVSGRVPMHMDLRLRFDYGTQVPWVTDQGDHLAAVAGPDAVCLRTPVLVEGADHSSVADFVVNAGDKVPFVLAWHESHEPRPRPVDAVRAVRDTERWWHRWSSQCTYEGRWKDLVTRSLITLKALTYAPTGGIVAAATTSLPEWIGSTRNWDYRYCWLRDSVLTLSALRAGGYHEEARAWRDWLLRAAAGEPSKLQIMYGPAGERRLSEYEAPWLSGYKGSKPVRIGNAASEQFQLDVYGEVLMALAVTRRDLEDEPTRTWGLETALLEFLEGAWHHPDDGIWEVRGARQHFTHSKVMAWAAFHYAIHSAERFDLPAPLDRWRAARDEIHTQVCEEGYDAELGSFVQAYGSKQLDSSLLMVPLVGFLPASDPRVLGTIAAIERTLVHDGLVARYDSRGTDDGLPPGEGVFLPCSFWLANNYALAGRVDDAIRLFENLTGLANDVGLLAEEYDPVAGVQLGNFPQAFTHMGLVDTAALLERVSSSTGAGSGRPSSPSSGSTPS
jgi:GH15 family glucan-1,4-alpha-glucosidase